METSPATLAERVGTLRASVQADSASGWLPPSLHALIMSCLARIFGRLEQMFQLWQEGTLPPPTPPSRRDPVRQRTNTSSRTTRPRTNRAPRAPHAPNTLAPISTTTPAREPARPSPVASMPSPPNRAARDPPSDRNRRKTNHFAAHPHALFIPYTE